MLCVLMSDHAVQAQDRGPTAEQLTERTQTFDALWEALRVSTAGLRFRFEEELVSTGEFDDAKFTWLRSGLSVEGGVPITDSFGIGVVPPPFHYTTAAEERLPGTEFYSAAVIAAGPAEYEVLLREELLTDEPDLLLIALFVGNDVEEASRFDPAWPLLRTCFDRSSLRIALLLDRLGRIDAERDRSGSERPTAAVQGEAAPRVEDRRESLIRFPWLDDPSLEEATLSAETFLEVESRRARFVCAPDAGDRYEPLFRALRAIRAAAGSIPIGVVLIPDEFQVEDAIWNQVAEQGFERDLPQQRIGAWLRGEGIATLDLLPTFRAFAPGPDGQRHLYHLRDTHWNRRGNALAGAELAAFAERLLDR